MNSMIHIKSKRLSVLGVRFCEEMIVKRQFVLSNQLMRSITSVGANVHESSDAESKRDFYHKMKIAKKELSESIYWIGIIEEAYEREIPKELLEVLEDCRKLLNTILATTYRSLNQSKS